MAAVINEVQSFVLTDEAGRLIPFESEDSTQTIAVTGTKRTRATQYVGTTAERLNLGEVTLGGVLKYKNLSTVAAEIIQFRIGAAGGDFARVKPGQSGQFRTLAGTDIHIIAASGTAVGLDYWIVDD